MKRQKQHVQNWLGLRVRCRKCADVHLGTMLLVDRMCASPFTPYRHTSWSKYVTGKAKGLVINGNMSTVPRGAWAHPHAFYWTITHSTSLSPLTDITLDRHWSRAKTKHHSLCQDKGEKNKMLFEERREEKNSQNSTQWNEVNLNHLPVR